MENITTADYLNQLIADKDTMVSNLQAKGVPVTGNETFTQLAPAIAEIPSAKIGFVKFYDYDGTLFTEWSRDEVATATALPAGPTHSGLVFQEWNWTLEEIKNYTSLYDAADQIIVGPAYTTDNGATKLYVNITQETLECATELSGTSIEVQIDWGDNTSDTVSITSTSIKTIHTYEAPGDYVIQFFPNPSTENAYFSFGGSGNNGSAKIFCAPDSVGSTQGNIDRNKTYFGRVRAIEFGNYIRWGSSAYLNSINLERVTMSNTFSGIYANSRCDIFIFTRDTFLAFPRCIQRISDISYTISTLSLPGNVIEFYWTPSGSTPLQNVSFPDSIERIPTSWNYFANLKKLVVPRNCTIVPKSIPKGLEELYLYNDLDDTYSVTMNDSTSMLRVLKYFGGNPNDLTKLTGSFRGINFETLDTNIDLTTFTSIATQGYTFAGCIKEEFDLGNVTEISGSSFNNGFNGTRCTRVLFDPAADASKAGSASYSFTSTFWLEEVILPDSLPFVDLGSGTGLRYIKVPPAATAGNKCILGGSQYSLRTVDYSAFTVVPTITSAPYSNKTYYPHLTEIIVPDNLYDEWVAADYWSTIADKIVKYSDSSVAPVR